MLEYLKQIIADSDPQPQVDRRSVHLRTRMLAFGSRDWGDGQAAAQRSLSPSRTSRFQPPPPSAGIAGHSVAIAGGSQPETPRLNPGALEEHLHQPGKGHAWAVAGLLPVSANVTSAGTPERIEMMLVSWNYFAVLGVRPAYGRTFDAGDDTAGVANLAVVSDGFWRRAARVDPVAAL